MSWRRRERNGTSKGVGRREKKTKKRPCSGTCMAAQVGGGGVVMVFHTNKMNETSGVIEAGGKQRKTSLGS